MQIKIGQRVNTKFGLGTIVEFERATNPLSYPLEYAENDRIAVLLDEPTKWLHGKGNPHFYANEISQ